MRLTRALFSVVVLSAVFTGACGSTNTTVVAPPPPDPSAAPTAASTGGVDQSFRKTPPAPGPDVVFVPPRIDEARLSNGARVLVVERHELPIVAVQLSVSRGADQAGAGVAGFVAAMLPQGTRTRSALQISDELGKLGASYSSYADFDGSGVQGQALAPKLAATLDVLADMLQNPVFDAKELERERARRLTAVAQENDSPSRLMWNALSGAVYPGAHPYGDSLLGTEAALKKVTRGDLQKFFTAHYAPQHLTIAFAGDITKAQAVAEAERVVGAWKGTPQPVKTPSEPPPPEAKDPRVILIDRPGASQSNVSIALAGVPRTSKDFDAITVMNTILGGQFSSRLNLSLREKHGYTYGARSSFDWRRGPGPFTAGGAIFRDSTDAGVREILAEVARMRSSLVSEEELADAKQNLIQQLPARFESASVTASTLASLSVLGLPLDEFATRPARFQRVTREDVKRVAETYLRPDRVRVVVVGDAAVVKAGLEKIGLGEVEVRKAPIAPGSAVKAKEAAQQAPKASAPASQTPKPAAPAARPPQPSAPAPQAPKPATPAQP